VGWTSRDHNNGLLYKLEIFASSIAKFEDMSVFKYAQLKNVGEEVVFVYFLQIVLI